MTTLSPDQIERILGPDCWVDALQSSPPDVNRFLERLEMSEPWPHSVWYRHYCAKYVPPTEFVLPVQSYRPSDCVWIVPGTAEARIK